MANQVIKPDAKKAFNQKKLNIRKKLNQMKKDGLITGREFIARVNKLSQVKMGGTFPASLTKSNKSYFGSLKAKTGEPKPKSYFGSLKAKTGEPKPKNNKSITVPTPRPNKPESATKTWKDYSSIAAAKADGALYYSKNGVKHAAVYASDLNGMSLRDYMNKKTGKTPRKTAAQTSGKKAEG